MQVTRTSLFDGKTLQIGTFAARPANDAYVGSRSMQSVPLPPARHVITTMR
jgi:hypothetical protein